MNVIKELISKLVYEYTKKIKNIDELISEKSKKHYEKVVLINKMIDNLDCKDIDKWVFEYNKLADQSSQESEIAHLNTSKECHDLLKLRCEYENFISILWDKHLDECNDDDDDDDENF